MPNMFEFTEADIETLRIVEKQRRAFGMTQTTLAERSERSRKTVMDIESGAVDPKLSTVIAILRQLGIRLSAEWVGLPDNEAKDGE